MPLKSSATYLKELNIPLKYTLTTRTLNISFMHMFWITAKQDRACSSLIWTFLLHNAYHPRNLQGKLDAFSKWMYLTSKKRNAILNQPKFVLIKPINFQLKTLDMSTFVDTLHLVEIWTTLKDSLLGINIRRGLNSGEDSSISSEELEFKNELFYNRELLYYLLDQCNSRSSKYAMIFLPLDILVWTKAWSW